MYLYIISVVSLMYLGHMEIGGSISRAYLRHVEIGSIGATLEICYISKSPNRELPTLPHINLFTS